MTLASGGGEHEHLLLEERATRLEEHAEREARGHAHPGQAAPPARPWYDLMRGATMLDPQLYEFFIRQWEAEINGLIQSGFAVNRRSPVVHTQARTESKSGRADRSRSQFVTGRDLMLGAAIVLHAISVVPVTVAGLLFMVKDGLKIGSLVNDDQAIDNRSIVDDRANG